MALYAKANAAGGEILSWGFDEKVLRNRMLSTISLPYDLTDAVLNDFGVWEIPFAEPPELISLAQKLRLRKPIWNEDNTALVRQFDVVVRSLQDILDRIENEMMRRRQLPFEFDFTAWGSQAVSATKAPEPAGVRMLQMDPKSITHWHLGHSNALAAVALGQGDAPAELRMLDNMNVQLTAQQALIVLQTALGRGTELLFKAAMFKDMVRECHDESGVLIDEPALLAIDMTSEWLTLPPA